jgi:predicted DNA-binding protein
MQKTKVISVRLSQSTEANFQQLTKERGIRINALLTELIENHLHQNSEIKNR